MRIRLIGALPLLALLSACAKEVATGIDYLSDPEAVVVSAGVGTLARSNPLGTEEEQRRFNDGDKIAISNGGEYVNYTFDGSVWTPETGKYLRWEKSQMTFNAYYPVSADNSFDLGTVKLDQSKLEDLMASDYMRATITADKTSDHKVSVIMKRKMARVIVHVKEFQDEFKGLDPKVSELSIKVSTVVNKYDSGRSPDGDVKAYHADNGDFYLLAGPSRANLLDMTLTVAYGDSQTKIIHAYLYPVLQSGKSYTFNLTVGKNSIKVGSVMVNDWQTGSPIDDQETEVDDGNGTTFGTENISSDDEGEYSLN